jgi:DNA-binding SARP family transcriptional activator/tetratricopeptide (TPR) repeat protein
VVVRYRFLGRLEVWDGDTELALGGPRERKVLALLLLAQGRTVPMGRLIEALWDGIPPPTAEKQVRNSVSKLRAALAVARRPTPLATDGTGYRLAVADDDSDAALFLAQVERADQAAAAGRRVEAAGLLRDALALWRGPPLAGLSGQAIEAAATAWDERRLAAHASYADHQLALGRPEEAVVGLSALVAEFPLREGPVGQLMVALHQCGRRIDALALYRYTRQRMAEKLGLDPSPALRDLHSRILSSDAAASPGAASADQDPGGGAGRGGPPGLAGRGAQVVPRQIPGGVRHFAGRTDELETLTGLLDQGTETALGQPAGRAPAVCVIVGMGGLGKTALAVHWAHQVADRFDDGQLYADLRGFAPSGSPVSPAEILGVFLEALAARPARIPAGLDARVGMYRSLLADRRMLIVLDDARDTEQVRPLLPASSGCFALITSRSTLAGLVVAEGAYPLTLDLMTQAEAHELLASHLGAERVGREPAAADELAELCARLPLALGITAARATMSSDLRLADLVSQLRDTRGALDALEIGEESADLRAVFSWSCRRLTGSAARLFRLLGLHPGPDISAPAAAALAGIPLAEASQILGELTRASLLSESAPGRRRVHDLLRAYAAEQADRQDNEKECHAAQRRMLDHYLHTAYAAAMILYPTRQPIAVQVPAPGAAPQPLAGYPQAFEWCEAEYRVLLAQVGEAAAAGFNRHAWQIPWAVAHFLGRRGLWQELLATQQIAVVAAGRLGDTDGQARAHYHLGDTYRLLGDRDLARRHLTQALALFERLDDQATAEHALARVDELDHDYSRALGHACEALRHYQAAGHRPGEARALNATGWYLSQLGAHEEAIEHCQRALAGGRELGDSAVAAAALDSLGYAWRHLGRHAQALACYREAVEILEGLGDRHELADTLVHQGDAQAATGDLSAAKASWHQAHELLADLDHPDTRNTLARLHAHSHPASVREPPRASLDLPN